MVGGGTQGIEAIALLTHCAEHTALLVDEVGGRIELDDLTRVEDEDAVALDDGVQSALVSGVSYTEGCCRRTCGQ